LQGPIDQYGLALYISGRLSALITIGVTSTMISKGLDVESFLTSWGISESLGGAVGTLAASSVGNIVFTPLHFGAVVYGIKGMEAVSQHVPPGVEEYLKEELKRHRASLLETEAKTAVSLGKDGSCSNSDTNKITSTGTKEEEEKAEKESIENGVIKMMGFLLLLWSLCVSMYSIRLMGKTATKKKEILDNNEPQPI